jgi:glutamate-1-semialdehyde 2,1-aminomutase
MAHFDKAAVGADAWLMQLGTLSGNPVAAAAGLKSLEILRREGQYAALRNTGQRIMAMIDAALGATGVPFRIVGDATLFEVVFATEKPLDYRAVQAADTAAAQRWNGALKANGIFKSPGKTYPSLALTVANLQITEAAIKAAAQAVAEGR